MCAKSNKVFKVISGWQALEIALQCFVFGLWQFLKISFKKMWKGHRRKSGKISPVELTVDTSVGTHCYVKVMDVKYHYVETGPRIGPVILVLGDAPDPGLLTSATWMKTVTKLANGGYRIITLDLRGTGASEGGNRLDLSPPRVVEELCTLLEAVGVTEYKPAIVIGHGIGGMVAWYLVHSHGNLISKFVMIDAPHPSLYWQYPPADFCKNVLHFIQWPYLPERWLAERQEANEPELSRWANSRACDWTGALNYVRGGAWYRLRSSHRATPPALLVSVQSSAPQLVASAERCRAPTLRMISNHIELANLLIEFVIGEEKLYLDSKIIESDWRGRLMGRVFTAVTEKGREISSLLLPPNAIA